jgi:iron complex transport system ATP-binding protein
MSVMRLVCRDVTVMLERPLVDRVSLHVGPGEWLGIVGANGAGKSTLLRAIAGLIPSTGSVTLGEHEVARLDRRRRARLVALVPQDPTIPSGMRVFDYVLLGRTPHVGFIAAESPADIDAVASVLSALELDGFADRRMQTLSGGERQRAVIARALAQEAPLLLLDEPTTALDIGHQQSVLELIDDLRHTRGLAVITTMHDLVLAGQYPDRLALMAHGAVVASGSACEVLTPELLAAHYDARVRVLREGSRVVVIPERSGSRSGVGTAGATVEV